MTAREQSAELEALAVKIRSRVIVDGNGCHLWQGAHNPQGYGQVWFGKARFSTHRAMYQVAKGPIPDGLHIDHLCRVRACCNPDHLEAVTPAENTRRGNAGKASQAAAAALTHCSKGHPRTSENMYRRKDGKTQCRICKRERDNAIRFKNLREGKTGRGLNRRRIIKSHIFEALQARGIL